MIKFTKLKIEGFASIVDPLPYYLNRPGINIIKGDNGSGKSTVVIAIVWCIYGVVMGKTGIEPWHDIRSKNFRGTIVSLGFRISGVKYQLIRCKDFRGKIGGAMGKNRLILKANGKIREDLRNKGDVQKELLSLLGYSFDVFKNSIVLGQNITRILDEKGDKQKDIMDKAFNTLYIQKAKDRARKDRAIAEDKISTLVAEIDKFQTLVKNNQEAYNMLCESHNSFLETKRGDLKRAKQEYQVIVDKLQTVGSLEAEYNKLKAEEAKLRKKLKKLLPYHDAYVKVDNEIFRKELEITQAVGELQDLNQKITRIKSELKTGKRCYACGEVIGSSSKHHIKQSVSNVKKKIAIKQESLETLRDELDTLESSRNKYENKKDTYKSVEKELEAVINLGYDNIGYYPSMRDDLLNQKLEKNTEISRIEERKWASDTQGIKTHRAKVRKFNKKLVTLEYKLGKLRIHYDLLDWLIKAPLSNRGLKAFIFNQLLLEVSNRTRYYERFSGISLDFSIDLESATKPLKVIVNKLGKSRSYGDLSGGERQLANTTASFAIHDIVTETRGINVVFLDEIFEGLDQTNIQIVSELIALRAKTQCVHLITHNTKFSTYNSNIVELERNKWGRTKVKA